jgi:hypothetical protein
VRPYYLKNKKTGAEGVVHPHLPSIACASSCIQPPMLWENTVRIKNKSFNREKCNTKQRLIDLREEINNLAIIVRDSIICSTSFSISDRISKQKVNKETGELNNTVHKPDLKLIYRTLHPRTEENVSFSCAHRTYASPSNKSQ